jgi:hypothetical protein
MSPEATSSQLPEARGPRLPGPAGYRAARGGQSDSTTPAVAAASGTWLAEHLSGESRPALAPAPLAAASFDRRSPPAANAGLADGHAATGVRWQGFLVASARAPLRDSGSSGALAARKWRAGRWPAHELFACCAAIAPPRRPGPAPNFRSGAALERPDGGTPTGVGTTAPIGLRRRLVHVPI